MKPLEHEDGDRPVRSPLDEARECIEQAIADLESQAEWIERKGDPQAHIKGRGEQALYELREARSALARLAAPAPAAEAEEAAKRIWGPYHTCLSQTWDRDAFVSTIARALAAARAEEREACAKVCDTLAAQQVDDPAYNALICAVGAIRARGDR